MLSTIKKDLTGGMVIFVGQLDKLSYRIPHFLFVCT